MPIKVTKKVIARVRSKDPQLQFVVIKSTSLETTGFLDVLINLLIPFALVFLVFGTTYGVVQFGCLLKTNSRNNLCLVGLSRN